MVKVVRNKHIVIIPISGTNFWYVDPERVTKNDEALWIHVDEDFATDEATGGDYALNQITELRFAGNREVIDGVRRHFWLVTGNSSALLSKLKFNETCFLFEHRVAKLFEIDSNERELFLLALKAAIRQTRFSRPKKQGLASRLLQAIAN